jgi:hypothetical protein
MLSLAREGAAGETAARADMAGGRCVAERRGRIKYRGNMRRAIRYIAGAARPEPPASHRRVVSLLTRQWRIVDIRLVLVGRVGRPGFRESVPGLWQAPRRCLACSRWSLSGRMAAPPRPRWLPRPLPGTPSGTAPPALPSPRGAARSRTVRSLSRADATGTAFIFPASYGTTPPSRPRHRGKQPLHLSRPRRPGRPLRRLGQTNAGRRPPYRHAAASRISASGPQ